VSVLTNFVPASACAAGPSGGEGGFALVAGRLVEEKGYDTAIRAARGAGIPLMIAGAGPDERRLRMLADGGEVRFCGWVSQAELAQLRSSAAVVLAPSRWEEPCPYAVLDSLAAGVPVLASDRGGLPELVGGDAALDPDDVDAWTARLRELLASRARREQLGVDALARAREQFGEERYYEALMRVYAGG
jgi:glycosyltransferase involved in cell wall biosynthesis